ncbi:MAG: hypothetical protein HY823_05900 [Acidobacteria bacterium]|nr:hypothetical protein [Acidobacteriota bacterium]
MRALLLALAAPLLAASPWNPEAVKRAMGGREHLLLIQSGSTVHRMGSLDPRRPLLPCSTYKLPHALIALERGILPPGADHRTCQPRECHSSHGKLGLEAAIGQSCVSFFRQLARELGPASELEGMRRLGYPFTGRPVPSDAFWLAGGELRITPQGQLDWIRRFYSEALPVDPAHLDRVRKATLRAEEPGFVLWGKTGSTGPKLSGTPYGWFVGKVAWRDGRTEFVVLLVQGRGNALLGPEAQQRLLDLLRSAPGNAG